MIIGKFRYDAEHDTYAGDIATLTLQRSQVMMRPNDKSSDKEPDYRITQERLDGTVEFGAAWKRRLMFFVAAFVPHVLIASAISLTGLACWGSTMSLCVSTRVMSRRSLTISFSCLTLSSASVRCSRCSGVRSPSNPSNTLVVKK